jgi:hypothetical protein
MGGWSGGWAGDRRHPGILKDGGIGGGQVGAIEGAMGQWGMGRVCGDMCVYMDCQPRG